MCMEESLAFSERVIQAHAPVPIQAIRREPAIEGIDERFVCWLARPGEVERQSFGMRQN